MVAERGLNRNALTLAQRCHATAQSGEQCKNPKIVGLEVCTTHGGGTKAAKAKAGIARVGREMVRLRVAPIDADEPEARGDEALAMELRRTIGWIRFCEDRITELTSDNDLIWGRTLEERKDAAVSFDQKGNPIDASYLLSKNEAAANGWVIRLEWNRVHLAKLTAQWIAAGFEAKRIEISERTMDRLELSIDGIVSDLGLDPKSASVRAVIRRRLAGVAPDTIDAEVVE